MRLISAIFNSSTKINTGGRLLFNALKRNRVRDVFIYSGGSVMPLIDSLYKSDINYFVNSHEQNTGHSATGYAKSSNRTGVCMVTSGPGITNMITPMLDAKNDSTPMVVFSGQVAKEAQGKNSFQEAPAIELSQYVTKWSYQVQDIHELPSVIDHAFYVANHKKKGPVHIDIPKCVSYQEYDHHRMINTNTKWKTANKIEGQKEINEFIDTQLEVDNKLLKVATLINNSKKPILIVGQGCINASAYLTYLAIKANIPVTSTIHGCGIYDENEELSMRWCGMHGSAAANYAIQEADLIIAIGSRFDDRTTGNISEYAPNAVAAGKSGSGGIVHVNIEKSELDFVLKSDYNFNMDCKHFLKKLLPIVYETNKEKRLDWINRTNTLKKRYPFVLKQDSYKLHMEDVIDMINTKTSNKDAIFTTGVGNHQMQTYQFIKSQYPRKILSSGSLGVMGAGLPYAVGAQIANPDKMVILIDGDSSFNMTLTDLKTIKEYNLPVKIAVMNNSAQMMVTVWEKLYFGERYTATINNNNPDYAELADSFGITSMVCDYRPHLEQAVDNFINYDKGPILCEFKIERDICLPLVGPGCALDDMILPESQQEQSGDKNQKKRQHPQKGLVPS